MKRRISLIMKALAMGTAIGLFSGCAVTAEDFEALQSEVAQLRSEAAAASTEAGEARFLAEKAMDEGRTANQCCAANTNRMERMFQKSMMK